MLSDLFGIRRRRISRDTHVGPIKNKKPFKKPTDYIFYRFYSEVMKFCNVLRSDNIYYYYVTFFSISCGRGTQKFNLTNGPEPKDYKEFFIE